MLMTHTDSALVTDAEINALPAPVRRGPIHQPVPHGELVRGLKLAALKRGYVVKRQQLALGRSGQRLFGVMDLEGPPSVKAFEDRGLSIGFRNSTDESLGIRIVAGLRVFVCDNLALSGDLLALNRRNTTGLDLDLALLDGFDRYLQHAGAMNERVKQLEDTPLTTAKAKTKIFDLFETRALPLRLFPSVTRFYFNPDESMLDCQPSTTWGLLNACTRAIKVLRPVRAFAAHVALGQAFGLSKN